MLEDLAPVLVFAGVVAALGFFVYLGREVRRRKKS